VNGDEKVVARAKIVAPLEKAHRFSVAAPVMQEISMKAIYDAIQENPQFFAWAFGVVNVLWILFAYFNKQSHERQLARLEQQLRLDADRRSKVFELKVTQYESYVMSLDNFGRKQQTEVPARMQPVLDKYLSDYLAASEAQDRHAERKVITWFSNQVSGMMQEIYADSLKLKNESSRLKLTATDEMIKTFSELESLTDASTATATEYMGKLAEILLDDRRQEAAIYQTRLLALGNGIRTASQKLLEQMRAELREI
jgi:hypothetical protein